MKSIFVFGLFEDSPGKTTFSRGLLHSLNEAGLKPAPLKARAGHNYWYQYDMLQPCLRQGRLYCSDIIKLREASGIDEPYEVLNPIDTLITPLDSRYYLENENSRSLYLANNDLFNHFSMERHTKVEDDKINNTILLRETPMHLVPEKTLEKFYRTDDEVIKIENLENWSHFYERNANESITSCTNYLETQNYDVLVSEGFCDIIYHAPRIEHDVVIGVSPGYTVKYPPKRFSKAIKYKSREGKTQFKASEIISYIKPEKINKISPLTSAELKDLEKVSEAYSETINSIMNQI
ncbi:hypothetical protein GF319_14835 [Candidatus Bathyarchaeota archaeon]|nr:hypothetical protein [Candidatus Bathyarchaeota archaeon]